MFDVGFWEIALLCIVVLVVVGPERLPAMMRKAGLWIGRARRIVNEVRTEVEREFQMEEIKRSLAKKSGGDEIKRLADRVKAINQDLHSDVNAPDRSKTRDVAAVNSGGSKSADTTADPKPPPE